jgi:hypothetical protein
MSMVAPEIAGRRLASAASAEFSDFSADVENEKAAAKFPELQAESRRRGR